MCRGESRLRLEIFLLLGAYNQKPLCQQARAELLEQPRKSCILDNANRGAV